MTRATIIAALAACLVTAAVFGIWRDRASEPDTAAIRRNIAESGKLACFSNARAATANVLVSDTRLAAFCACTFDRSVAGMTDEDVRQATLNEQVVGEAMRARIDAATATCRVQELGSATR